MSGNGRTFIVQFSRAFCTFRFSSKKYKIETDAPFSPMKRKWGDIENQKKFFEYAAQQLNIKDLSEWYNYGGIDVNDLGGAGLLNRYYRGSLADALMKIYPEYPWKKWHFKKLNKSFWEDRKNQRLFLDTVAKDLNIKKWEDWYRVKHTELIALGGRGIVEIYGAISKIVISNYPEHPWISYKFYQVNGSGYWTIKKNQIKCLEEIAKSLELRTWEDWYNLQTSDYIQCGGEGLLGHFGGSHIKMLMTIFPQHDWKPWKFTAVPKGYWLEKKNQLAFIEYATKQLGIKDLEDWYKVSRYQITELGGKSLLSQYPSFIKLLASIFPDYQWKPFRFAQSPDYWWEDKELVKEAVDFAAKKIGIENLDDWYGVTTIQLKDLGLGTIMHRYGGQIGVLKLAYPNHTWEAPRFRSMVKSQNFIFKTVSDLIPQKAESEIFSEFLHPQLEFKESGMKMELDIWIPSLSLAFEYQGIQHYEDSYLSKLEERQPLDQEKKEACERLGIHLVTVPYTWDKSVQALIEMIKKQQPHIVQYLKIPN